MRTRDLVPTTDPALRPELAALVDASVLPAQGPESEFSRRSPSAQVASIGFGAVADRPPNASGYEIIASHHRKLAAETAGLPRCPAG